jgi:hypothetical protein
MDFPVKAYLTRVYMNVIKVTVVAGVVAWNFQRIIPSGWLGFVLSVLACVLCAGLSVLFIGCSQAERNELVQMVARRIRR